MFVTVTDIKNEATSILPTVLDNKEGNLYVALRGLHYDIGARNIGTSSGILWRSNLNNDPKMIDVPAGMYTFEDLKGLINEHLRQISIELDEPTKLVTLTIPTGVSLKLSPDIRKILGIHKKDWIDGVYEGDRPTNFNINKWLFIHLDQLSTAFNNVNGLNSTLLTITPTEIRGVININPPYPMYKKLEVGMIHQLTIRMLDENNAPLSNRGKPMIVVLEIRKKIDVN